MEHATGGDADTNPAPLSEEHRQRRWEITDTESQLTMASWLKAGLGNRVHRLASMRIDKEMDTDRRARLKRAELAGGVGAGALGMGLGVLLASYLRGAGAMLLLAGAALHASGMWDKHRMESSAGERRLWWETLLYWGCWAILAGLFVYVVARFRT